MYACASPLASVLFKPFALRPSKQKERENPVGVLECWSVGVLECWSVGVLECWSVGVLECWSVGVLECWSVGVLECWRVGVLVPRRAIESRCEQRSADSKLSQL